MLFFRSGEGGENEEGRGKGNTENLDGRGFSLNREGGIRLLEAMRKELWGVSCLPPFVSFDHLKMFHASSEQTA